MNAFACRRAFVIAVLAYSTPGLAAGNPAERYVDAYKGYVSATCPIARDEIHNFVYFAKDREAIHDHPLLTNDRFAGAQVMYAWKEIEPSKDRYDFSLIEEDRTYLAAHGKRLFIQLQDATFSADRNAVPAYLQTGDYDGGVSAQYDDDGKLDGWVAKRWNANVRERFARLLAALGKAFDGKIEGLNLQESSIGVTPESDPSFSDEGYVAALKANMKALKAAFPRSTTMQYANFMPGEWLPWQDKGYLREIYRYGQEIGVGLGAPDLMPTRKGQLNHPIAMMHENNFTAPLGVAVQDGNYIGETNNLQIAGGHKNIVPLLHAFAKDFLKVDYMFWVDQKPYFEQDVLPCFAANQPAAMPGLNGHVPARRDVIGG